MIISFSFSLYISPFLSPILFIHSSFFYIYPFILPPLTSTPKTTYYLWHLTTYHDISQYTLYGGRDGGRIIMLLFWFLGSPLAQSEVRQSRPQTSTGMTSADATLQQDPPRTFVRVPNSPLHVWNTHVSVRTYLLYCALHRESKLVFSLPTYAPNHGLYLRHASFTVRMY